LGAEEGMGDERRTAPEHSAVARARNSMEFLESDEWRVMEAFRRSLAWVTLRKDCCG
jgi:hypothetical protein